MKKGLKAVAAFFGIIVLMAIIAAVFFPTGADGKIELPSWYLDFMIIVSITVAVYICSSKKPDGKRSKAWIVALIISLLFALIGELSSTDGESGSGSYLVSAVLVIVIAAAIAITVYVVKRRKQAANDQAGDLLADIQTHIFMANKSNTMEWFFEEWDSTFEKTQNLIPYEKKVKFSGTSPSSELARLKSEEQKHIRDAIDRAKDYSKEKLKDGFRSYDRLFEEDLMKYSKRYDIETAAYADTNIREVYNYAKIAGTIAEADTMEGHQFEYWCADLLRKNGFTNVEVTPGSGDHGVDVIAEKGGIKYAVQCKCYSKDLGNKPVQEVNTGKAWYHCQIGVVMTNQHFTTGAKEDAEINGILLWDREKLAEMIGQ